MSRSSPNRIGPAVDHELRQHDQAENLHIVFGDPSRSAPTTIQNSSSHPTRRRREPDSNPRSHPTALAAAHIGRCSFRRPDALQQRRSPTARATRIRSASIVGSGYIVRELRYFRPVRPKRPESTSGTRSSNPLSSTGESNAVAPRIVWGANLESKLCDVLLRSVCRTGPHSRPRMMALHALD